ncbi:MAG TPA: phosphate ABC transporter permease family protein, partial [Defluviicoccus sp.]|nr:phosphate ABC transporter permease family protein [Defluviicoccus sp.]
MSLSTLLLALLVLSSLAFYLGRKKALSTAGGNLRTLHSLPNYYGYYLALWAGIPALAVFTLWLVLEPQ